MGKWEQLSPRQRRRKKKAIMRQSLLAVCALVVLAGVGLGIWGLIAGQKEPVPQLQQPQDDLQAVAPQLPQPEPVVEPEPEPIVGLATEGENMAVLTTQVGSEYAVFIDADTNTVLAEKGGNALIYPASMTKVLTILTAAEAIEDPDAAFTMTQDIIDPHYRDGATITGFRSGDECTLRELFYGAALRSAADATTALAIAAAGSESAFVDMMNAKCRELGLSQDAHFTNTSGLFHQNHTCTLRDMAAIMRAAMANDLCREILTTDLYVTAPTAAEPEGITFQNKYLDWFLEKQPEGATVTACKSGYVAQALNCLVSYGTNAEGRNFICVIARANNAETMMGDHRTLYSTYGQ